MPPSGSDITAALRPAQLPASRTPKHHRPNLHALHLGLFHQSIPADPSLYSTRTKSRLETCYRVAANMGASDSKLVFKKGIFRLSGERSIAADDPYWTSVRSPSRFTPELGQAASSLTLINSSGSSPNPPTMSSACLPPRTYGARETMRSRTSRP